MNQIETLKWIADNGNPVGTEADSSYLQYKDDPRFRKIAIALARSESGYAGVSDEIKNEYQSYKSEINKQIADSLRAKAKSDYENETQSSYLEDVAKLLTPRTLWTPGFVPAAVGSALDIASLPGRTVLGVGSGLATGLLNNDVELGLQTASDVMGRKSSPEGSGFVGFVEDVVKDPLLPLMFTGVPGAIGASVKGFGKAGQWLASHPKTAAGLAAGLGNLGIGATERGVDPTREVYEPGAALAEGVLGFGLGFGGKGGSQLFEKLGNTEAGRAILKKITPTELRANMDERLAKLIEQGYGVKILDEKGNVDAAKLGNFLSEQSKGTPGTKIERIPDWISSERSRVGKDWRDILEKYSEDRRVEALRKNVENPKAGVPEALEAMDLPGAKYIDPMYELNEIVKQKQKSGDIFSLKEAKNLFDDLHELLPNTFGVRPDTKTKAINVEKLADLQQYLYNEGREMSPKYHKTREELATELRKILQEKQADIVGEDNIKLAKQYSALSDLENLTGKSNYFNPDRPSTFWQGVKSTASKNIPDRVAPTATEAIQAMVRRGSRTPATPIGGETNQPGMERYSIPTITDLETLHGARKISRQELNAGERALSMLMKNPNDSAAKATIDSLLRK